MTRAGGGNTAAYSHLSVMDVTPGMYFWNAKIRAFGAVLLC